MRIGLDATRIFQPTGEGVYTREVIQALVAEFAKDEFVILVPEKLSQFERSNVVQVIYPAVDGIASRLRYAIDAGRISKQYYLDIFHNLTNYLVIGASCPVITTIHDLVTLKYPGVRPGRLKNFIYRYAMPKLLARSSRLVAISKSTERDIIRYYALGGKTRVIYNGVDHDQFNTTDPLDDLILDRFSLPCDYLLFVGYLSPKKNLDIVLHAIRYLLDDGLDVRLVLVGKRGYGSDSFFKLAQQLGLSGRLIETGFVSRDELTLLYRRAGLFVFPSVYEGFGLPVIEALACGIPVIVSNTGPMPELVADPECRCDPGDARAWADGIRYILMSSEMRERFRTEGPLQAARFSWINSARSMRALYDEAVAEKAS